MRIEFEKLEQRPGTHVVPVKMSREDLEVLAERMAGLNVKIAGREADLRSYAKEVREEVKGLEDQRDSVTTQYRAKRDPKAVSGLWGFDFNDTGDVACKKCIELHEKHPDTYAKAERYVDSESLIAAHGAQVDDGEGGYAPLFQHPLNPIWSRPLGTKWFVEPSSGDVFGPLLLEERDFQHELFPATVEIQPFSIAFESEAAIPLLTAEQVSAAEKKLRTAEKEEGEASGQAQDGEEVASVDEETHGECGLPLAWHPEPSEGEMREAEEAGRVFDACKGAMLRAADEAQKAQERRTEEEYGGDDVLDPETVYPCGKCNTPTFGRDLQKVNVDGEPKDFCFACEKGVGEAAVDPKPKKKAKKKAKGQQQPEA